MLEDGNGYSHASPVSNSSSGGSNQKSDDLWGEFTDWKLWVLVVGGMKALEGISSSSNNNNNNNNNSNQNIGDREFFRRKVRIEMAARGLEDWEEVKDVIGGLVWIDAIHGGFLAEFGREVMSRDFREGY